MTYKYQNTRHTPQHHMYHNDQHLDLARTKAMALDISLGRGRGKPTDVTIHFHPYLIPCDDREHEFYPAGGKREMEETDDGRANS